jgi:hypothetical protein
MWCEVAEESVVVNKSRPKKAGNRLEGKTGMTWLMVARTGLAQKARHSAKGGSSHKI